MADNILNVRIQTKCDTETNWSKNNPILLSGEMAISLDNGLLYKVGDGAKRWSELQYLVVPWTSITERPSAMKNPTAITIKLNGGSTEGTNLFTYDGSTAKSLNITPSFIGASPVSGSTALNQLASTIRLGDGNGAMIDQDGATYRQRISIIDNATAGDSVFEFLQSSDSGNNYTALMTIRDDGKVTATEFIGSLTGNATTASKLFTSKKIGNANFDGSKDITLKEMGVVESIAVTKEEYKALISSGTLDMEVYYNVIDDYDSIGLINDETPASNQVFSSAKTEETYAQKVHTHTKSQIVDFPVSMPASDVYDWAKAANKPTYNKSEVGLGSVDNAKQVKGLASGTTANHVVTWGADGYSVKDSGFTIGASVPAGAKFTDTVYTHPSNHSADMITDSTTKVVMTATERTKLSGIAEGANKYAHPTGDGNNHIPTGGASNQILRYSASGTAVWSNEKTYSDATATTSGLMSAAHFNKLAGIAENANNYTHPTTTGNKHIPSGGASGQILRWSADGTAVWGNDNNTTYSLATSTVNGLIKIGYTATGKNYPVVLDIDGKAYVNVPWTDTNTTYTLSSFGLTASATELNYVKGVTSAIQTQLNGKAPTDHKHTVANITDLSIPTSLPTPNGLTFTGAVTGSWNGTNPKTVNIPTVPTSLKNPYALTINGITYDGSAAKTITISGNWSGLSDKPDMLNCMRMYGGTMLDSSATTSDANAQYPIISKSISTSTLFSKTISDLPKGMYSVMVRMKVSSISSSSNIFKLDVVDGSNTYTRYIQPSMFNSASKYTTLGFVVEHTSSSISVKLSIATSLSSQTVGIDYLLIAPAMNGLTSIA